MFRWGTVSVPLKPALERLLMSSGAGRRTNHKPNKPNKRRREQRWQGEAEREGEEGTQLEKEKLTCPLLPSPA